MGHWQEGSAWGFCATTKGVAESIGTEPGGSGISFTMTCRDHAPPFTSTPLMTKVGRWNGEIALDHRHC